MTTLLLPDAAGGTLEKALYDRFASSLEAQGWEIVGGLELLPGASGRFVERVYKFKIRKGSSDEEMDVVYKVFRDKPSVGDQSPYVTETREFAKVTPAESSLIFNRLKQRLESLSQAELSAGDMASFPRWKMMTPL